MAQGVGVPTVSTAGDALKDYGYGLGGGLLFAIAQALFGSGFFGGLVGAVAAGSIVKGPRGQMLATMLGFQSIVGGLSGSTASASSYDAGVM